MPKTDLNIIILNYNSHFWLKKTLETLQTHYLSHTKLKVVVTVVDNASSDESVHMLKHEFKWVQLLQSPSNNGFAAGNNLALKQATCRYVMLLNSDVESTENTQLDVLIDLLDNHPEVAVVTPKIVLTNGKLDPACHRGEPTLWAAFTYFSGLSKVFPHSTLFGQYHQTYLNLDQIHAIDACSGAAMIVRTAAMKKVGYLDEQFFMYAEDLDWCKRFREAGYAIVYHPGASLIHHKYKSGLSSVSPHTKRKTATHFYDTMLQYYDKHYQNNYPVWVRTSIKYLLELKKGAL